jgi:hypothetical protein
VKNGLLAIFFIVALSSCVPAREVVEIYKGDPGKDGTSCSVGPEYALNELLLLEVVGARISCTDGSFAVILNGAQGPQGIQGPQGVQGIQGPQGEAGASCQAYRAHMQRGVYLQCPDQEPVFISDGDNCTTVRQNSKKRSKIVCGNTVSYVYDGVDGAPGTSCTVTPAPGGALVQCGSSTAFLAHGADGQDGRDGEDAVRPGLSCNVHNMSNWNGVTNILTALTQNAPVGNFVLPNLNVGNSTAGLPSSGGFPGMPAALQNAVGLTGYALDCNGYLNIETSGMYQFKMLSDDGVRLVIDNNVLINNPGIHPPTYDVSAFVELQRGQRSFNVIYYQGPATQIALQLQYSGPFTPLQVVPAERFRH